MTVITRNTVLSADPLFSAGLTDGILRDVIIAGETLRARATEMDPISRGGHDAWAEAIRRMRELLMPMGWTMENPQNLPIVVTPCGRHSITVSSGNASTGLEGRHPKPKNPKGPATVNMVGSNQTSLFADITPRSLEDRLLWVLLVHHSVSAGEVRAELSLPLQMADGRGAWEWPVRYILEPLPLREDAEQQEDYEEGEDIDFNVPSKRQS